ncbi:MAG TPA: farnesyl diphosphate synthase [Allosphingosinicella sp.]|nr:farnesyl diphosphate synthase [Allosphingosinicella sp.]
MAGKARPVLELDLSMRRTAAGVDRLLESLLPLPDDLSPRLIAAMRYAATGGGKRLRPLLVLSAAGLFGVPAGQALRAGLAVECLHVNSLIHDDLPCMDDDDVRRGRPTVHRAFDEATAVLAGDALMALAFEILSAPETHPRGEVRAELVLELARAAGAGGMAGGQMLDLCASEADLDMDGVTRLQRLKTGALIGWCVDAGAILGNASAEQRTALRGYARCLGLAFQIADDLLDATGDEAAVGKKVRKDEEQGKRSFVSLLGVERARAQAELLAEQAVEHLRPFDGRAQILAAIAHFAVTRDR